MELAVAFGLGFLIGAIVTRLVFRAFAEGVLHVDTSDPEDGPYIFLELSKSIGVISKRRNIVLKVSMKSFLSHK